ncbi:type II secretion system protein [Candidatus Nomurabacteria bacterium]|nr:type II secretion system protein [Candidatus Nomurabacteria bacterium]
MKKFTKKNYGFSLIELLVVIAIMIALSALVLARLDSVRDEVADTVVKANLENIRAQAKNYFFRNGNYGTATLAVVGTNPPTSTLAGCSTAGTFLAGSAVSTYLVDAEKAIDPTSNWVAVCALGKLVGETNATSWIVAVPLKSGNYWCVSSNYSRLAPTNGILGGGASAAAVCNEM